VVNTAGTDKTVETARAVALPRSPPILSWQPVYCLVRLVRLARLVRPSLCPLTALSS